MWIVVRSPNTECENLEKETSPIKTKVIALLLAIVLALSLLSGCGGKSQTLTLSPETTAVTTDDGITVDVGSYVLDGEAELTVTKQPVEEKRGRILCLISILEGAFPYERKTFKKIRRSEPASAGN